MTANPQRVDVERLRELLAKATPGPWSQDDATSADIRGACGRDVAVAISRPMENLDLSDKSTIAAESRETAGYNAELIVAAVNALPALLLQVAAQASEIAAMERNLVEAMSAVHEADKEIADLKGRILRANKRKTRHKQRAEAAERARDECVALLREAQGNLYHPLEPAMIDSLESRIAAFLAANGGQDGR